jgi:hypothetical protein
MLFQPRIRRVIAGLAVLPMTAVGAALALTPAVAQDGGAPGMEVLYDGNVEGNEEQVHTYDWPIGTELTLTVDDPTTGVGVDWSMGGIEIVSGLQEIDVTGSFDFQTGHQVALTDGTTTLEHIVGPLQITSADRATDGVTGVGIYGTPVNVDLGLSNYWVDPAEDGTWQITLPSGALDDIHWLIAHQGEPADPNADSATMFAWTFPDTGYVLSGFARPVDDDAINVATAGRTVPLKFRVTTSDGDPVSDIADVSVTVTGLPCELGSTEDQIEEHAAGSSGQLNFGDGYYQYNWKTPRSYQNSCKLLELSIDNGPSSTAEFHFTR